MQRRPELLEVGGLRHAFGRRFFTGLLVFASPPVAAVAALVVAERIFPLLFFGPYLVLAYCVRRAGHRPMAVILAALPFLIVGTILFDQVFWRSGLLFGPEVVLLHVVCCAIGFWQSFSTLTSSVSNQVALDDAGLRVRRGRARQYWPLELIQSVDVVAESLVVRAGRGTEIARVPLYCMKARRHAAELEQRLISKRMCAAHSTSAVPRVAGSLDEWCGELARAWADSRRGAYRGHPLDAVALALGRRDPDASAELRAAATHLCILAGGEHARSAIADLGPTTPPIELALAAMAARTARIVPRRIWRSAMRYLDPVESSEVMRRLRQPATARA